MNDKEQLWVLPNGQVVIQEHSPFGPNWVDMAEDLLREEIDKLIQEYRDRKYMVVDTLEFIDRLENILATDYTYRNQDLC